MLGEEVCDRKWEMEGKRKSFISKVLWKKLRVWGEGPEEESLVVVLFETRSRQCELAGLTEIGLTLPLLF